jgi:membrane fusion protein (multidrug efflux system)
VTLRAMFPNPDHTLLPGMFVHARLKAGVNANAILAPQQGVTRDLKGAPTALVVNQETRSNCASSRPAVPWAATG